MAKTVKFNLIMDGYPVRNLESLQEHFSIEDMLDYYNKGILVRWLKVRGYGDQLEKVQAIGELGRKETAKELIKIFEIEVDEAKVEESLAIFNYFEERKIEIAEYKENSFKQESILDDYHAGYTSLVQHMIDHNSDMALLKADAYELEKSYMGLFVLDYFSLYMRLVQEAPKAVYAMLARPKLSEFYLGENAAPQITKSLKTDIIPLDKICEHIAEDITVVNRNTQGMWDPIERGDVKLIVLYVASTGAFVKNYQGDLDEKLGAADVNGMFKIFNGLEYQCNNESNQLVYMEV